MKKVLFFLVIVAALALLPALSGAEAEQPMPGMHQHGMMQGMQDGPGMTCPKMSMGGMHGCGMMGGCGCGCGMPGCGMTGGMHGMRGGGMMGRGMHGMGHGRFMRMLWSLDLSDTQRADIMAIHDRAAKDLIRRRADIQIARVELKELVAKEPVDMTAVDAKVRQLAGLKADMLLMIIKTKEQVKAVLTPEQRNKLRHTSAFPMAGMGMMQDEGPAYSEDSAEPDEQAEEED